jgi:hypothetical protein
MEWKRQDDKNKTAVVEASEMVAGWQPEPDNDVIDRLVCYSYSARVRNS